MGMIPVVLAIAGFVLLWIIVNYNSLSTRRTNIASLQVARDQLLASYVRMSKELSALLLIYKKEMPVYLVELANDPSQKINASKLSSSIKQLTLQANGHTPELQNNPDYQELLSSAELTATKLIKNQQRLETEIKAYNQQATRMPYRIVAQLFGFKRINSLVR
ncbi:LemA family protein [Rhodocytophaga aerolata]|uniref:LemA family protein n=1 Tax=Rhodocytophaga aerolata TaxID=455078 RepID=A0ABT8R0V4_9BACT|nr:LemA family protein [Rhodocytophaga aerolata]MDO1445725.1 LemA family protein [Rhodocytophaga aerolata]